MFPAASLAIQDPGLCGARIEAAKGIVDIHANVDVISSLLVCTSMLSKISDTSTLQPLYEALPSSAVRTATPLLSRAGTFTPSARLLSLKRN